MLYAYQEEKIFIKCSKCENSFSEDLTGRTFSKLGEPFSGFGCLTVQCPSCNQYICYNLDFSQEIFDSEIELVDEMEKQQREVLLRLIRAKREDFRSL